MFKLYSVSIRACNRYQCIQVAATLQYARIVCFYGLCIEYTYAHTLYYIRDVNRISH
jgi:hypothetical protein